MATPSTVWTARTRADRRRRATVTGAVAIALVVLTGAVASVSSAFTLGTAAVAEAPTVTPSGSEPGVPVDAGTDPASTDDVTTEPTRPTATEAPVSTEPGASDTPSVGVAAPADETDDLEPALTTRQVQEHLRASGFLVGPADGREGQQTTAAVMAFQRVNGLAVDGVVGPATTAALRAGSADPELVGGPPDRIEVDLDEQLLHLVEGGQRIVTLHVSSGSGETYTNARGPAVARTPVGTFAIERRVHGVRTAALGTLYDPLYFHGGFAIHGSPSVPAFPASHGCVRITRADAAWLIQRVPDGMPVLLHGGVHVFAP